MLLFLPSTRSARRARGNRDAGSHARNRPVLVAIVFGLRLAGATRNRTSAWPRLRRSNDCRPARRRLSPCSPGCSSRFSPTSPTALARPTNWPPRSAEERLSRLLYALAVCGLLERRGGGFANGPEAATFLVKGLPRYIGGAHELLGQLWHADLLTAQCRYGPANRRRYTTSPAPPMRRWPRCCGACMIMPWPRAATCCADLIFSDAVLLSTLAAGPADWSPRSARPIRRCMARCSICRAPRLWRRRSCARPPAAIGSSSRRATSWRSGPGRRMTRQS
jgi:hypothetical protein